MARSKYYYMALAKKKKTPRQMTARYHGTCSECLKPVKPGQQIVYLGATKDVWHLECYPAAEGKMEIAERTHQAPGLPPDLPDFSDMPSLAERAATQYAGWKPTLAPATDQAPAPPAPATLSPFAMPKAPEPVPTREDRPPTPDFAKLELNTGVASLSAWTDTVIRDEEGKTLFVSILGTDSTCKACSGFFTQGNARGFSDGLYCQPLDGHGFYCRRGDGQYRIFTTKLTDRACHQIVCDERFLPGVSMEKDFRFLLADPSHEPAALVTTFLKREVPTPVLPDWQETIFARLLENWKHYQINRDPGDLDGRQDIAARARAIPARVGQQTAYQLRVTEESYDQLISRLVKSGQISF